eukprot:1156519-Pelagomonas_calceolata.AAC.1
MIQMTKFMCQVGIYAHGYRDSAKVHPGSSVSTFKIKRRAPWRKLTSSMGVQHAAVVPTLSLRPSLEQHLSAASPTLLHMTHVLAYACHRVNTHTSLFLLGDMCPAPAARECCLPVEQGPHCVRTLVVQQDKHCKRTAALLVALFQNTAGIDAASARANKASVVILLGTKFPLGTPKQIQARKKEVQGKPQKTVSNLAHTSQGHIFFYKVKSHAGIAGNECADTIAEFQASLKDSNLTDTGIPSAGPGGNPFYNIAWLTREEARPTRSTPDLPPPGAHSQSRKGDTLAQKSRESPPPQLKSYKEKKANGDLEGYWKHPAPEPGREKLTIFHSTSSGNELVGMLNAGLGTLYNQKHAVRFKRSTSLVCPLLECHHMDSALHILSGCQCPAIRHMATERHNIASRMILKVVGEGSYGSNLKHLDVGSADRLAQMTCLEARRTSSRHDAILVTPCPANPKDHLFPPHIGYSAV